MLVRALQPENASSPMEVTLEGILMLVSAEQDSNAYSPMEVTLEGMLTLVSALQFKNAPSPIEVTPRGIVAETIVVDDVPLIAMFVPELETVRLVGTHTADRVTLAVPIVNVAPDA
jgi:hypothetical protein